MEQSGHGHQQRQRHLQNPQPQQNRFSWQTPPETPPEVEVAAPTPSYQTPAQYNANANVRTSFSSNGQYMYPQSQAGPRPESYAPAARQSVAVTPIDPRPQSVFNPSIQSSHTPYSEYPPEKTGPLLYTASPPTEPHPAFFAPITPVTQPNHSKARGSLHRIDTNVDRNRKPTMPQVPQSASSQTTSRSAHPQKTPITPSSPGPIPIKRDTDFPESPEANRQSTYRKSTYPQSPISPYTPYSPHGADTPVHAVFTPDAATGPNGLNPVLHQPGQIAHPNMDLSAKGSEHEWKHALCECGGDIGTCMTGLFCPCILYGKTAYRLSQKSEKRDPTDMLGYSATNAHCGLMSLACGFWWLFPLVHRTRLRHTYKLKGSLISDICDTCCCCCCVAIQNEREIRDREENARRWAGPANAEAYASPAQMVYAPPPRG